MFLAILLFGPAAAAVAQSDGARLDSAWRAYEGGAYSAAIDSANVLLEAGAADSTFSPLHRSALVLLACSYAETGDTSRAVGYFLRAIHLHEQAKDNGSLERLYEAVAGIYDKLASPARSVEYRRKVVRLQTARGAAPDLAITHRRIAESFLNTQEYDSALAALDRVLDIQRSRGDSIALMGSLRLASRTQIRRGDFPAALQHALEILELARRRAYLPEIAIALNNIGYLYTRMGDHVAALQHFRRAIQIEETMAVDGRASADAYRNLGIAYQNLGNFEEALDLLRAAERHNLDDGADCDLAVVRSIISELYLRRNDYYNAAEYAANAVKSLDACSDPEIMQDVYSVYAEALQARGDFEDALVYYRRQYLIRDSINFEQRLRQAERQERRRDVEQRENEMRLLFADQAVRDLELKRVQLEQERAERELELLRREDQLKEAELTRRELERRQAMQALQIAREQLENEQSDRELAELRRLEEAQRAELETRRLQERERANEIELLENQKSLAEKERALEAARADRNETRTTGLRIGLMLAFILLAVVSWSFFQKRRDNRKLASQRDAVAESYRQLDAAHKQLQQAQSQLVEAEKMASLGQLTAGIAHEINNPINFVSSNVGPLKKDLNEIFELLQRYEQLHESADPAAELVEVAALRDEYDPEMLADEIRDLLTGIEEGARRTRDIVLGLRNFSRADENDFKPTDLQQGLESTLLLLRNKLKHRVEVHRDYQPVPPVECLPGKINQVFMNILTNAHQAIKDKGDIFVSTRPEGDKVLVEIRDTGSGMSEEIRRRIFEPFYTTKGVGQGTGLGLSISFGIIENHGGSIAVDSVEGRGSTFAIRLPLKQALRPAADENPAANNKSPQTDV